MSRKPFKNSLTSSISMLLLLRCPFGVFSWLGFMVFWRPSKSYQKPDKNMSTCSISMFVTQMPFWCCFVTDLYGFFEAVKK